LDIEPGLYELFDNVVGVAFFGTQCRYGGCSGYRISLDLHHTVILRYYKNHKIIITAVQIVFFFISNRIVELLFENSNQIE